MPQNEQRAPLSLQQHVDTQLIYKMHPIIPPFKNMWMNYSHIYVGEIFTLDYSLGVYVSMFTYVYMCENGSGGECKKAAQRNRVFRWQAEEKQT